MSFSSLSVMSYRGTVPHPLSVRPLGRDPIALSERRQCARGLRLVGKGIGSRRKAGGNGMRNKYICSRMRKCFAPR